MSRSARASERGYNGRRSPGPNVGGPRNITSPSRVVHLHAHGSLGGLSGDSERIRSFGRVFPLYFLRQGSLLTVPQHGRCARRIALLLFRLVIVKYKRLERSADSSPAHLGFVRNEYLVASRWQQKYLFLLDIARGDAFYFNDAFNVPEGWARGALDWGSLT